MSTDERASPQMALDLDSKPRRIPLWERLSTYPTIASLQRVWQQLTWVSTIDPLRRLLNQGFAAILLIMIGFVIALAATLFLVHDPAFPVFLFTCPFYVFFWWLNRRGNVYGIVLTVIWGIISIVVGAEPSTYVGTNTPIPLVFIFPMVIATLFLRPQAGLWSLVLLMATFGVRLAASDVPTEAALRFMLIGTENLGAFTAFLMLGTSILHRALRTSFEANAALQRLVNATFEAIAIHDNGTILEVNPAFCNMVGVERSAIIGKDLAKFIAPDQQQNVRQKIVAGDTEAYETLALRHDHMAFPIELVSKPINYLGHVVQITAMHNITERKLAESQRLELALAGQKTEILREFLNTVSHDLKTPLSVINTIIYLLEKEANVELRKSRLDQIKAQSARLAKLIDDVVTTNRMEMLPDQRFQQVDVNAILTRIKTQFDQVAEKQQQTIELQLDSELPFLRAREEELARALINLVENALRYTPAGGIITIRTFAQPDKLMIEVQDTGIGIDAADQPRIFEHFYRTESAKAKEANGTGLGLAIVKKIVELHHGSIEVESEPEKGSIFRVRLPQTDIEG